jgi:heme-degrading monooxygenase HmoA
MESSNFACTPKPPYFAVIFASQRSEADAEGYDAMAARMLDMAATQPGFLGIEHARGGDGFGLTVSYWHSEASILAWKHRAEHAEARARGRSEWYARYELRVARVERAYGSLPKARTTGERPAVTPGVETAE